MFSRGTEVCLFLFLTSLLFHFPLVHAGGNEDSPDININIDIQGIINAIIELGNNLGSNISNVPSQVLDLFKNSFKSSVNNFNEPQQSLTIFLLSSNPNPSGLYNWWQTIILIISSFYLLLFLIVGLMFLYSSIDIEKRVAAKQWLKNALIMIVLVNASFWTYNAILEIGSAITNFMWEQGTENLFTQQTDLGAILLILYSAALFLTLLSLFIRYLFLTVGVLLFPIGIFLYYIPPLQNWGKIIFNTLGLFLFIQFVDIILLVASYHIGSDLAGQAGVELVLPLALLVVGLINFALMAYAILKSIFDIQQNSQVLGYAIGTLTGQLTTLTSVIKNVVPKK